MAFLDSMASGMGLPDRRPLLIGGILTIVVHICLVVVLATAGGAGGVEGSGLMAGPARMCGDARCPESPFMSLRRGIDSIDAMDAGIIEASVVPMLGMAKKLPGQLPRFQKYEQAARIDEAVNISKKNENTKDIKNKDVKAKDAEVDRRRKNKDLGDILDNVPDDDDPRARATALDKLIGSQNGSVNGYGTEAKEGSEYGARVGEAIRGQFTIPPYLTDAQLKKLSVSIQISKISAAGQILEYRVVAVSPDNNFNSAALYAIRRFSQKDGGSAFLPAPDLKTLDFVNLRGIRVDLNGALFRR